LQKEEINPDFEITNLGKTFNNFTETASAIKNMDLIISTDNVILNLSGALGVKTIGLFNKDTNYRWFKTKGNDVCWYNSTTPLQAETQDDWDFVIKEQMISIINSL
jgi:ADP-heptose:LPS heptosyltransferase